VIAVFIEDELPCGPVFHNRDQRYVISESPHLNCTCGIKLQFIDLADFEDGMRQPPHDPLWGAAAIDECPTAHPHE
jgi:hypothetical protein